MLERPGQLSSGIIPSTVANRRINFYLWNIELFLLVQCSNIPYPEHGHSQSADTCVESEWKSIIGFISMCHVPSFRSAHDPNDCQQCSRTHTHTDHRLWVQTCLRRRKVVFVINVQNLSFQNWEEEKKKGTRVAYVFLSACSMNIEYWNTRTRTHKNKAKMKKKINRRRRRMNIDTTQSQNREGRRKNEIEAKQKRKTNQLCVCHAHGVCSHPCCALLLPIHTKSIITSGSN